MIFSAINHLVFAIFDPYEIQKKKILRMDEAWNSFIKSSAKSCTDNLTRIRQASDTMKKHQWSTP